MKILPTISMVDVIITDPPYGDRTIKGARTEGTDGIRPFISYQANNSIADLIPTLISKARRWVIVWYDIEAIGDLRNAAPAEYVRAGFFWKKNATPQFTGDRPAVPGEACAIFHRVGKKRWNGGGKAAYWEGCVDRKQHRYGHPTPKPIQVMREQVGQFTERGETVLDPFMGSGTTGAACVQLGRKFIGIEINKTYFAAACKRISDEYRKPKSLFRTEIPQQHPPSLFQK